MSALQALKFKNFTDRDFTWSFDGIPFTFKAGDEMYMEDYKARHFAKHLVDRELNLLNIPTNMQAKRAELEQRCFPSDVAVTPEEAINIEETKKEVKRGRPKKKVEEEFPDLQKNDE